jgi:hypothetical protein
LTLLDGLLDVLLDGCAARGDEAQPVSTVSTSSGVIKLQRRTPAR